MNAQVKRKPTKTRTKHVLGHAVDQNINPRDADALVSYDIERMTADAAKEALRYTLLASHAQMLMHRKDLKSARKQRDEFDLAACIMSDMLTAAEIEKDRLIDRNYSDFCAGQAKIKRLEHSADYWRNCWVSADRKVCKLLNVVGFIAGLLVVVLCVWGAS